MLCAVRPPEPPLLAGPQKSEVRATRRQGGGRTGSTKAFLIAAALAVAVFAFYFAVYPARHLTLPVGFDTSWYVWRAQYVAVEGVGRLGTSLRPGHALLSSVLGSVTGLNQLELAEHVAVALEEFASLVQGHLGQGQLVPLRGNLDPAPPGLVPLLVDEAEVNRHGIAGLFARSDPRV